MIILSLYEPADVLIDWWTQESEHEQIDENGTKSIVRETSYEYEPSLAAVCYDWLVRLSVLMCV